MYGGGCGPAAIPQTPSLLTRASLARAIRLESIAGRIDDKRRIVIVAIVLAQTGLAVVASTGAGRRRVEFIDSFAAGGVEAYVQPGRIVGRDRMLHVEH